MSRSDHFIETHDPCGGDCSRAPRFGVVAIARTLSHAGLLFVLLLAYLFPSAAEKLNWRIVLGAVLIVPGVALLSR